IYDLNISKYVVVFDLVNQLGNECLAVCFLKLVLILDVLFFVACFFILSIRIKLAYKGRYKKSKGTIFLFVIVTPSNFFKFFQNFIDRKSTRLNSSHVSISYAVFCLKK